MGIRQGRSGIDRCERPLGAVCLVAGAFYRQLGRPVRAGVAGGDLVRCREGDWASRRAATVSSTTSALMDRQVGVPWWSAFDPEHS
nr:hypothetical protein [Streptomyces brasiliensis]